MALKSSFTKGVVVVAIGLLALTLLILTPLTTSAEENNETEGYDEAEAQEILDDPESYINYLENYSEEDAIKSGVDESYTDEAVKDAEKQLKKFEKMTTDEQNEMLDLMKDPEIIEESNRIVSEEDPTEEISLLAANQKTVSHQETLRVLGIDWTEYKITGVYNYNNSGATSSAGTQGIVVKNLNPMVKTSNTSNLGKASNGTYTGTSTFEYKLGPLKGVSLQVGTYNMEVEGNQNGKIGGRGWSVL